jgi:hypothetical protein
MLFLNVSTRAAATPELQHCCPSGQTGRLCLQVLG